MLNGFHIAFFGSSILSAYWNGAATYYRGILRQLHLRGARISFYEPDAYGRQQHRDIEPPPWAEVIVYEATETGCLRALEDARSADMIVKASGVGVYDELLEREIPQVRRQPTLIALWDVDAPATLDRLELTPDDPLATLIPEYDYVFTYGGGDPVVNAFTRWGARICVPIYNALDPDTHHPVPAEPAYEADLSFLGNRLPDREKRVEEFFLKAAGIAPRSRFLLGGSGWEDKSMPPNVRYAGFLPTAQHNAWNCTPRAVLNISRESMARYGFSPATRVFEAAGAGACIITDAWEGISTFLEPDREILVAADGSEVAAILEELSPERGREIGQAALQRVTADHTYAQRAAQWEAALSASRSLQEASL